MSTLTSIMLIGLYGVPIDCNATYGDTIVIRDESNRIALSLSDEQLDALTAAIEQVRAYRLDAMKVPVEALPDIAPPAFPTADGMEVTEYAPVAACAARAAIAAALAAIDADYDAAVAAIDAARAAARAARATGETK